MTTSIEITQDMPAEFMEQPERRIIVDHDRVNEVLGRLMLALGTEQYPYNLDSTRLPQDARHMPETLELGTEKHARFLFNVCYYMRGGIKSNDAVTRLSLLYDKEPELFVPEHAKDVDPEHIEKSLSSVGLGFQKKISEIWVENASRLDDKWHGDPRNIFEGISTYEECQQRIMNDKKGGGFIGFQEKMVSMLTYYLMDEMLIDYFQFPLPVDIHVLRVSIANELIKFEGYETEENVLTDELLQTMRDLYFNYAVENNINVLRLCDAVWQLSMSICGKQPGNITLEPEGRKNRKGRKTLLVPLPIDTDDKVQIRRYNESCAQCPIESTCKWNVPGKIYYVAGDLVRRGERVKFPLQVQTSLL